MLLLLLLLRLLFLLALPRLLLLLLLPSFLFLLLLAPFLERFLLLLLRRRLFGGSFVFGGGFLVAMSWNGLLIFDVLPVNLGAGGGRV